MQSLVPPEASREMALVELEPAAATLIDVFASTTDQQCLRLESMLLV